MSYADINLNQRTRRVFIEYIVKNRFIYISGFFVMLLTSLSEVSIPWLIGMVSDLLISSEQNVVILNHKLNLEHLSVLILICAVLGYIGRIGWRQTLGRQTHKAGYEIKVRFWNSLKDLPLRIFSKYSVGDLLNRATGDWNHTRFIHGFTMVMTLDMIFLSVLAITLMVMIDWQLTICSILVIALLPKLMKKLVKKEQDQFREVRQELSDLSDLIQGSLETVKLQRSMNSSAVWMAKLTEKSNAYRNKRKAMAKTVVLLFPISVMPILIAYLVLLTFGLIKVTSGEITIGEFIAFEAYILIVQIPLFELSHCIAEWQYGKISFRRILEILNLEQQSILYNNTTDEKVIGNDFSINVRNLKYSYDDKAEKILKKIDLTIAPGERIGIFGKIGSGKTTLLKIICGLLDIERNSVMIGGVDVVDLGQLQINKNMAMVSQDVFLFSGTIRENLNLNGNWSDEELVAVLKDVCLYDDFFGMKDGLDTIIGEKGVTLSGGQKQRLSIARAILRDKNIYLLDDCLSAVDSITESKIVDNLVDRLHGKTIIWVSHRISTLSNCTRIYELKDGLLALYEGGRK